jgi:hypothetical protein
MGHKDAKAPRGTKKAKREREERDNEKALHI